MIRRAVVVALALVPALPSIAHADVVKKAAKQSPEAVREYWTAERMRNAIPVHHDRAAKENRAKPGSGTSSWTSFEADLTGGQYTDRRHGKVFFSDGGSNYVCSGTALANGTRSVVWTAGHCTVEGGGLADGPYDNWTFAPAYRDGVRPLGTFSADQFFFDSSWDRHLNYGRDFAAVRVHGDVEKVTGPGFALATGDASTTETSTATTTLGVMKSHGYPAEGKFNGQRQNVCRSNVIRRDQGEPPTMGINCDSNGGSSGGGWVDSTGRIASVNSYGYGSLRNVMFGPAHDSVAAGLYDAAND
jgi:hypothetical protein